MVEMRSSEVRSFQNTDSEASSDHSFIQKMEIIDDNVLTCSKISERRAHEARSVGQCVTAPFD